MTTRSWCQPLPTERPPQLNRCSCLHLPPGQAKGGGFTAWVFQGSQTQANGGKDLGECFRCFSRSLRRPRRCDSGLCSVAKRVRLQHSEGNELLLQIVSCTTVIPKPVRGNLYPRSLLWGEGHHPHFQQRPIPAGEGGKGKAIPGS